MIAHLQYQVALGEVSEAIIPLVSQGNPYDPITARRIVRDARLAAIRHGNANNNLLIAEVLKAAGVSHVSVKPTQPSGPQHLDESTHPELFTAVSKSEGSGLSEYVRAVGQAVDIHTPDAPFDQRLAIFYGFIRSMSLPVTVDIAHRSGEVHVKDTLIKDVLRPNNPTFDVEGWTVSPYTQALGSFIVGGHSVLQDAAL